MKNKEKYANEIIELAIQGLRFGVDKQSNRVAPCNSIRCNSIRCVDCLFHGVSSCSQKTFEWANAEYEEPKIFTEREKAFLKLFPVFQYIAKDKNGEVFAFISKPVKGIECWISSDNYGFYIPDYMELHFNDIRWEDEEPTSREEILGDLEMTVTFGINEDKEDEAAHFGIKEDEAAKGPCI